MYSYRQTFNEKQLTIHCPAFPTPSHLQGKLIEFVSSNRESYFHLSKHVLKAAFFFSLILNILTWLFALMEKEEVNIKYFLLFLPFSAMGLYIFSRFSVEWCSVAHLCPILCSPVDCSPPGSSAHGIFQARILEWSAISYSGGSS